MPTRQHTRLVRLSTSNSLRAVLSRNDVLAEVLSRTATLDLPGWYVTAGCLFQTVWNVVTDRPPTSGIKDYHVFYCDKGDLSWKAEDAVDKPGQAVFADLPAEVEITGKLHTLTSPTAPGGCGTLVGIHTLEAVVAGHTGPAAQPRQLVLRLPGGQLVMSAHLPEALARAVATYLTGPGPHARLPDSTPLHQRSELTHRRTDRPPPPRWHFRHPARLLTGSGFERPRATRRPTSTPPPYAAGAPRG
ncbi:nucleotidyltransferase family protein [Streptomyces zhihengii]|uniref:nucleotidyltransferase family protein n=1 Tax=Streptomyces zhihengii TaxID=1818004 RepID=UPI0033A66641